METARVRERITETALIEKIMALLVARPACADARFIMLDRVDPALGYNWKIGHFDPGRGDRWKCKMALRAIHEELRDTYELAG